MTGKATPEQIEAAAEAIRERSTWPSMHWPDIGGVDHLDTSNALASAALVAAAGVTPQEPTREQRMKLGKMIEQALGQCGISVTYALAGPAELFDVAGILLREYPAFATPSQVDEAALYEAIDKAQRVWNGNGRHEPMAAAITRSVLELVRGGGQ